MNPPKNGDAAYAERLTEFSTARWKQLLDVQMPYRWHLRSLKPGHVLDIGCGIGRNLEHLRGNGVGIDTNEHCLTAARAKGFQVFTPSAFSTSPFARTQFDSLLFSHVVEHMTFLSAQKLVATYLGNLKKGGRLICLTPQEKGFQSDSTHVDYFDFESGKNLCRALGLKVQRQYSFPFPRFAGRFFLYNEFVLIASFS